MEFGEEEMKKASLELALPGADGQDWTDDRWFTKPLLCHWATSACDLTHGRLYSPLICLVNHFLNYLSGVAAVRIERTTQGLWVPCSTDWAMPPELLTLRDL